MRRTAVAAAICFAACGTEPTLAPPSEQSMTAAGTNSALVSCALAPVQSGWLPKRLLCGTRVLFTSSESSLSSRLQGAITMWNAAGLGQNNLPGFFTSTPSPNVTVSVAYSNPSFPATSTTWYCGDAEPGQFTIIIHKSADKASCGGGGFTNATQIGGLTALLAHEMSHVLGFKHISQNGSKPAADHCLASIPDNGFVNTSLCQAAIELVHYEYGLRADAVNPSNHIATGLELSGATSLVQGTSGTLTVTDLLFSRAAPSFTPPAPSTQTFTWTVTGTAISLSAGSGPSKTVQAVQPGTATIRIRLNSFEEAEPFMNGDITFTVTAPPTEPLPPTSLTASAVGTTSATVGWTNGASNTGTTTTLQYRKSGVSTWTTASSTIAAGVSSYNLTGLSSLTTYDARAWHVRSGLSSDTTTRAGLFTTLDPNAPPTITNFRVTGCVQQPSGSKTFNYFTLSWNATTSPPGGSFSIGVNTSNNPAGAAIALTVPSTARSGQVGGYLAGPTTVSRWFWIRYNSGPWIPLIGNPLATNICAL